MIGPIKDLFFRRMKSLKGQIPDYYNYVLTQTIRHKLIGTILDHRYQKKDPIYSAIDQEYDELEEWIIMLEREFGKNISNEYIPDKKIQDFLFKCELEEFLTAIELLLTLKFSNMNHFYDDYGRLQATFSSLITKINSIFKIDKIGYEIIPVGLENLPFIVVPFNSQYLHLETIKQPIDLMYNEEFKGALNEFQKALDKYRINDFENAIINANKSYESTLKSILIFKKITFDEGKDKLPQLIDKVKSANIIDSTLETVFKSFWPVLKNGPNNIRNLSGIAHGQGIDVKKVEKTYADFVLRTVGTYIVFLIERFKETK